MPDSVGEASRRPLSQDARCGRGACGRDYRDQDRRFDCQRDHPTSPRGPQTGAPVVIDLRNQGSHLDDARAGLDLALRRYGLHLDETLLVLADDLAVGWFHG